jgi:hypothetical protein
MTGARDAVRVSIGGAVSAALCRVRDLRFGCLLISLSS